MGDKLNKLSAAIKNQVSKIKDKWNNRKSKNKDKTDSSSSPTTAKEAAMTINSATIVANNKGRAGNNEGEKGESKNKSSKVKDGLSNFFGKLRGEDGERGFWLVFAGILKGIFDYVTNPSNGTVNSTTNLVSVLFSIMIFIFVIITFYGVRLSNWKEKKGQIVVSVVFFLLDNRIIQNWIMKYNFAILYDVKNSPVGPITALLSIFFVYYEYISWWFLLGVFGCKVESKSLKFFRATLRWGYIIFIIIMAFMVFKASGGVDELAKIRAEGTAALQKNKVTANSPMENVGYTLKMIGCCIGTNTTCCENIGKPKPTGTSTKENKTELILLQGGVDEKLSQQLALKLTAQKNAASNYWEKEIIATASVEATAGKRDMIIDTECYLKDTKQNPIEKSGITNPRQVYVKNLNLVGAYENVACKITSPKNLKVGTNNIYFKASVKNQLQLSTYLTAYFIKDEELQSQLNYYLSSDPNRKESFISTRTSKGILEAQKDVYARLYEDVLNNDYPDKKVESKSEVGFIKFIINLNEIPIIGIKQGTNVNMWLAIENMIDGGKITDVKAGKISIPKWLRPINQKCEYLISPQEEGDYITYTIDPNYLKKIKWKDVAYGNDKQKKLSVCTLEVNDDPSKPEILYNINTINPKIIRGSIYYDYEMEAIGTLTVNEADFSKVQSFAPSSDQFKDKLTKPINDDSITSSDISKFGEMGYNGRKRDGIFITAKEGSEVVSATDGRIIETGCLDWAGNYVYVEKNGFVFMYGHLKSIALRVENKESENVVAGSTVLGTVGTTAGCNSNCNPSKENCGAAGIIKPAGLHFGVYESNLGSNGAALDPRTAIVSTYNK